MLKYSTRYKNFTTEKNNPTNFAQKDFFYLTNNKTLSIILNKQQNIVLRIQWVLKDG